MLIQGLFIFAFHCIGNTEVCIVFKQFEICVLNTRLHYPILYKYSSFVLLCTVAESGH